jgi:mannose-6-phosphate isomerase-like protein (cupin superfamily)
MKSRIYAARIIGVLAVPIATLLQVAAQDRNPSKSRLARAAKPVTPTPFKPPNCLIWRLSEILAAHKGQASWWQPVVKTRDFEADWISMAPGAKTKTVFYADDRVFWVLESGQMRVNIEGQQPFMAKKGFLVQAAPPLADSMETVGNEPVLRPAVRPAGDIWQVIPSMRRPLRRKGGRSFNRPSTTRAATISTIAVSGFPERCRRGQCRH